MAVGSALAGMVHLPKVLIRRYYTHVYQIRAGLVRSTNGTALTGFAQILLGA
jgi:hypothetical protein